MLKTYSCYSVRTVSLFLAFTVLIDISLHCTKYCVCINTSMYDIECIFHPGIACIFLTENYYRCYYFQ